MSAKGHPHSRKLHRHWVQLKAVQMTLKAQCCLSNKKKT